ncbi:hypothetical protein BJ912DRAFT_348887 [Pholiota molesta]|nr:hypothetical protein BJ912DRAFT_348887 [Pholiota molesta]
MARQKTRKVAADTSSPRKSQRRAAAAASEASPTPKQRKISTPSRCSRCEGRPLRSQCEHTKQGKDYILAQEASKNIENAIAQDGPPSFHSSPRSRTVMSEPTRESPAETTPVRMDECVPPWVGPIIDPTLIAMSTPGRSDAGTSNAMGTNMPAGTTTPSVSEPGVDEATSSPGTPKSKRIRATASNARFGHVEGVCRGFTPHNVYRKHAVPDPIPEGARASKTFLEKMNSLVEQCEDISLKTGAWLFVGAQHPGATGGSINYSSPRLRRDGGQKTSDFATMFLKLIKKVADTKRKDTFEFQKIIEAEREKMEQVQKDLEAVRAQAASDSQELALFRERFGVLEGSN